MTKNESKNRHVPFELLSRQEVDPLARRRHHRRLGGGRRRHLAAEKSPTGSEPNFQKKNANRSKRIECETSREKNSRISVLLCRGVFFFFSSLLLFCVCVCVCVLEKSGGDPLGKSAVALSSQLSARRRFHVEAPTFLRRDDDAHDKLQKMILGNKSNSRIYLTAFGDR